MLNPKETLSDALGNYSTKTALAEATGLSRSTIDDIELGRKKTRFETIVKLVKAALHE